MKLEFYVCIVSDSFGNKDASVCNEMCDEIFMCGVKNLNNEFTSFEDEAKHLKKWCDKNGINYYCKKMVIDV